VDLSNIPLSETDKKFFNDWAGFFNHQMTWFYKQFLARQEKIICLFTGNQKGKCFSINSVVYTPSGIKFAEDIKTGDLILGGEALVGEPFEDDVYEVKFSNGVSIKCNKEHPFWCKDYGNVNDKTARFIPLENLTVGKYVLFSPSSSFDLESISIQGAKLLGYLCSDGYLGNDKQSPKFTNGNLVFLKEVWKEARELFPELKVSWRKKGNGYDLYLTDRNHHTNNRLKEYILSLGVSKESFGSIVNGDTHSLEEFIKGYFNGDGYLLLRKRKNGWSSLPSVEIGFCIGKSKIKAYELQYILWKLGIQSWIISERMKLSKYDFWRVKVTGIGLEKLISILDWTKYPSKFKDAIDTLSHNRFRKNFAGNWVRIKSIEKGGQDLFVPITTTNGEIYSSCGLKTHNTEDVAHHYWMRLWGRHPIASKNMRPDNPYRIIRCASAVLPAEPEGGEVKNTQYPALKRVIPLGYIKKDITIRKPVLTVRDPQGGPDVYFEFVSYKQETGDMAGVQRFSVWLDEKSDRSFFEEQIPRLFSASGDLIYTLTPADYGIGWEHHDLFSRAKTIIRSDPVLQRYKDRFNKIYPNTYLNPDGDLDCCILMGATDDNPIYTPEKISKDMEIYTEDIIDIRRYGISRQATGQIFEDFDVDVHQIDGNQYFDRGMHSEWVHARGIDFHEHVPWACGFIALSPQNEAFIYDEFNPSPDKMVTLQICRELAYKSQMFNYKLSLIDPWSSKKQPNTGLSPLDDINRAFYEFRREGICSGGYWQTWDTKSAKGRNEIKLRLKNARLCGKPFNNRIVKNNGKEEYLPTLWIFRRCHETINSFKNWRWEQWTNREMLVSKDEKDKPEQKWSHFPMVYEAIFKHPGFSIGRFSEPFIKRREPYYRSMSV
jgi:hypothetical protein